MQNGVRQLAEIMVYYAPKSGSSVGVRDFLFNGPLARWMVANPHVNVKTYVRGSKHPFMICKHQKNFLQRKGERIEWSIPLRNKSAKEVESHFDHVNNNSGGKAKKITQRHIAQPKETIQGFWTPEFQSQLSK
uniref:Ribosomal protein/NADH dehydrogenase domain-containing protein n=1 Tax=Vannella robusta TaxID=1487602 RepID=A0A7S4I8L2_9EUKA